MKFWTSLLLLAALLATTVLAQRRHPVDPPTTLRLAVLRKSNKCPAKVSKGADVTLHYRAWRWNDEEPFESTYEGEPMKFTTDSKKVIPGLEMGIEKMCVGEVRRLLIPSDLAYGELGIPGLIEPNTNLVYEVELIKSMTTWTNPWFYAGLFGLGLTYLIFERLSTAEDQNKAARFVEKKEEAKQKSEASSENVTEPSDKKND
ncbi:FK506-binding protein 2A [Umbelopsis sp. WA50703]